jgi:hypothetical protein
MIIQQWVKDVIKAREEGRKRLGELFAKALPHIGMRTRIATPSKHQGSKRNFSHSHGNPHEVCPKHLRRAGMTNHERVVAGRKKQNPNYLR